MFWQALGYGVVATIALIVITTLPVLFLDFRLHKIQPTKYYCDNCGERWPTPELRDAHQEFCDLMPFLG